MLSPEELAQVTEAVMGAIGTNVVEKPVIQTNSQANVIVPDEYLQALIDAKKAGIDNVVKNGADIVYVRGRRGTVEDNRTKDTLNMLDDQINEWRDKRTHRPVK